MVGASSRYRTTTVGIDPQRSRFPANPNVPNAYGITWTEHCLKKLTTSRTKKLAVAEEWFIIVRQLKTVGSRTKRNGITFVGEEQKFSWGWGKKLFDMLCDDRRDISPTWVKTVHHGRDMTFNKFLKQQRSNGRIVKDSDGYMIPMHVQNPFYPLYYKR